ncbi:MAG: helix-turn-helix transcriptional regulator [Oligoflexia bacterium]|nr:helix-turn-helix transcriptional regulator [Oligoflexia bacterium]MBF0366162.1 helix-turn-helix transcriptional regulator [Oligoflexia bacterium]
MSPKGFSINQYKLYDEMLSMELKRIFKQLIKENETSVAKVSKATKIPTQALHNWLTGVEPKSFTQVKRVADFFQVSLDYLCFGIQKESGSARSDFSARKDHAETIQKYNDEINAGIFEVVLRRVKRD